MVHRATAALMVLCVATAACLYIGPLAQAVGRRYLMATAHEWSGILLPVPFLLGLFSADFRADLRRLNRFAPYDRRWLRAVRRRSAAPSERPAGKLAGVDDHAHGKERVEPPKRDAGVHLGGEAGAADGAAVAVDGGCVDGEGPGAVVGVGGEAGAAGVELAVVVVAAAAPPERPVRDRGRRWGRVSSAL